MELYLILLLVAVFAVAIVTEINIGLLALAAALAAGTYLGMSGNQVFAEFPAPLFLMLFGLLLLLGIAMLNRTVDWLVSVLLRSAGGRLILIPWALLVAAFVTSSLGPAAFPILFVIGAGLSKDFDIPPLLLGALVVHGNQAGMFSPIAPYGLLFSGLVPEHLGEHSQWTVYGWVAALHIVIAVAAFIALGGRKLAGRRLSGEDMQALVDQTPKMNLQIACTLLGLLMLVFGAIFTDLGVGVIAIFLAFLLSLLLSKEERTKSISAVPWGVLLVIAGVLIYVAVLQEGGAIIWLADHAASLGSVHLVVLALCYLAAMLTAISSTFGTFGVLIPLSAPFVASGDVNATALLSAIAVSAAVTDICPFSPIGAMLVGSHDKDVQNGLQRSALSYTLMVTLIVPPIVWAVIFGIPMIFGM